MKARLVARNQAINKHSVAVRSFSVKLLFALNCMMRGNKEINHYMSVYLKENSFPRGGGEGAKGLKKTEMGFKLEKINCGRANQPGIKQTN